MSDPRSKTPADSQPLVRDASEDTGLELFAEPGGNLFGEDSTPSLVLIDPVDENESTTPSLNPSTSDTPLDAGSIALFGK